MMDSTALLVEQVLLYAVAPVWMLAGLADFTCHRVKRIEETAGVRESLLHLMMLAQLGVAAACPLLLQPTAAVLAVVLAACLAHEATTCADLALRRVDSADTLVRAVGARRAAGNAVGLAGWLAGHWWRHPSSLR